MVTDLGKISQTTEGEYDSEKKYERLDTVSFDGSSYLSRINNNDQPLTNLNAWQISASKGKKGDDGANVLGITDKATPSTIPTPWDPEKPNLIEIYAIESSGTYTNFIQANSTPVIVSSTDLANNTVQIWVRNGVSEKVMKAILQPTQYIPAFIGSTFPLVSTTANPIQRTYGNAIWELKSGQTAQNTDIPGVSDKWEKLNRELPINIDYIDIQRPDINRFIILDSLGNLVHATADIEELEELKSKSLPENAQYISDNYDRPDLIGIITIDKNGRVPEYEKSKFKQIENKHHIIVSNPSFSTADNFFKPVNIYQAYDDLMTLHPNYITKESIGKTSIQNMDIWLYKFKPRKPLSKFLLITGNHASEKVYQKINLDFATKLCNDWKDNGLLTYLRSQCEIHFIPLNCPANALGLDGSVTGGRKCSETDPIDITWTKTNGVVTVTYNVANFPASNPNVNGGTYFSEQSQFIVNRLCVTIYDSSNQSLLPNNGYELKSVINGNTITINSPETTTSGSGSAKLVIYTDIARNMNLPEIWRIQPINKSLVQYPSEHGKSFHDNIGTKPASLNEAKVLETLINSQNYDYLIDCHSGAGTNYVDPLCPLGYYKMKEQIDYLTNIVSSSSDYALNCTAGEVSDYRFISSPRASSYTYFFESQNKPSGAIEWSHPNVVDEKNSTDAYNLLTCTINLFNNLKK